MTLLPTLLVLLSFVESPDSAGQAMARATADLAGPRMGFEDGPLTQILQRAMVEATGAQLALTAPLGSRARVAAGPVNSRALFESLAPEDLELFTVTLTGARIRGVLEESATRFTSYAFDGRHPLLVPGEADSLIDSFEGVSYEIDLTRPAGDRVLHLTHRGAPMAAESSWTVAVDQRRLARGDLGRPHGSGAGSLRQALVAHVQRLGLLENRWERDWSILPDYAVTPHRSSIDRLVRNRGASRDDVFRIYPDQPARRGDLAYRLASVFGWRERRPSGAFPDVPDSLEVWVDGLLRRHVLGAEGREEFFRPFAPVTAGVAMAWCEAAARSARSRIESSGPAFRRALLPGIFHGAGVGLVDTDTLDQGQMLTLVANLRFPRLRLLRADGDRGETVARVRETIQRLIAEDPEGTVRLDTSDTALVFRGIPLGVVLGAGENGSEVIRLGAVRIPLAAREPGRPGIQVCELTVDPMSLRALEVIEYRLPVDAEIRPASLVPTSR